MPFLACIFMQEQAWSLYIFFQNHNYEGGIGNFTYVQGFDISWTAEGSVPPELLSSQIAIAIHSAQTIQLFIITLASYIASQLASQLVILYQQNYFPCNSQLYILLKLPNHSLLQLYIASYIVSQLARQLVSQLATQLVSYIAICDWICQNQPHMHTIKDCSSSIIDSSIIKLTNYHNITAQS